MKFSEGFDSLALHFYNCKEEKQSGHGDDRSLFCPWDRLKHIASTYEHFAATAGSLGVQL